MKRWYSLVLFLPFLLVFIGLTIPNSKNLTCKVFYEEDLDIKIQTTTIKAEKAQTPDQRTKGLSGRDCINANQGMLFEFERSGYYPFWMKDMKFPIDIIWINKDHRVVTIKPNVAPSTYPQTFTNNSPAQYVLELKAGQAANLIIQPGTKINF